MGREERRRVGSGCGGRSTCGRWIVGGVGRKWKMSEKGWWSVVSGWGERGVVFRIVSQSSGLSPLTGLPHKVTFDRSQEGLGRIVTPGYRCICTVCV